MSEHTMRSGGSLRRWEEWIETWLSPSGLDRLETVEDEAGWQVEFCDGSQGEIRIKSAALHSDPDTFRKITERLDSTHWVDVVRRRGAIRIHDNAWIEKIH